MNVYGVVVHYDVKYAKIKANKENALTQDRTTDLQFTRLTLYH